MATVGTTVLDTWWTSGGAWSASVSIDAIDLPPGSPKDRVVFILRRKNSHNTVGPNTVLTIPAELTAGPVGSWSVSGAAISQAGLRADHARRDELPSTLTWTMSVASGAPQSTGFIAVTPIIIRAGDVTYSATSNRDATDPIRTGDITNADRGVSLAMIATYGAFHRLTPTGANIAPDPLTLDNPEGWTLIHSRVDDTDDPGAPDFINGYWSQLSIAERTLPAGTHTAPSWQTLPFSELNFGASNIMLNAVWTPTRRPRRSVGIIMR